MIQNLDVFESDAIIIDLEDSVQMNDKDAARRLVYEFLYKYKFNNLDIYIRLNDIHTPYFFEDIKVLDELDIKGYVIPKAVPEDIKTVTKYTKKSLIAIVESPMAVLRMEDICKINQVEGLLLGGEDLTKEIGVERTIKAEEIKYARQHMVIVCSAYQKLSIDTPWTDKDNMIGLKEDTLFVKGLGFTSKSSIHPNHVDVINQVFTPSEKEVLNALRIVKKAETETKGAFSLDGKMVDVPVIERAKKVILKAKKYNIL